VEGVAPAPVFVRRCAHEGCERTCRQPMPRKVGAAALEHRLRSGRVVDVALLARAATQGLPIAAVEVHWSHAVDDDKRGDLPIPWVEVEATQVCENLGRVLVPRQDHLLPWLCAAHASTRGEAARETRETRRAIQALVGSLPYRPQDFPGFHVHALTRCPRGHEALVWAWEGDHPPWPRPPHVTATSEDTDVRFDPARAKAGRTLAFRRRYQSVCAVCGAALEE
jgi:hypothetical protein